MTLDEWEAQQKSKVAGEHLEECSSYKAQTLIDIG